MRQYNSRYVAYDVYFGFNINLLTFKMLSSWNFSWKFALYIPSWVMKCGPTKQQRRKLATATTTAKCRRLNWDLQKKIKTGICKTTKLNFFFAIHMSALFANRDSSSLSSSFSWLGHDSYIYMFYLPAVFGRRRCNKGDKLALAHHMGKMRRVGECHWFAKSSQNGLGLFFLRTTWNVLDMLVSTLLSVLVNV